MISTERCFHVLLAATFVAATLAGNVDQWFPLGEHARLASALLDREPIALPSLPTWVVFAFAGTLILGVTVTFVGLVNFKRWSRTAALVVTAFALGIKAFGGTGIASGTSIALSGVMLICWGAAIAMTYCSPLSERFKGISSDS